jgi:hypothetical protein
MTIPALLPGPRCFTDASLAPHQTTTADKATGLGVFLINTQTNPAQTINIQGTIDKVPSVIMAEAAALALAARIASVINLQRSNYLSDNDSSVKFFNSTDLSAPPDWRIKAIT